MSRRTQLALLAALCAAAPAYFLARVPDSKARGALFISVALSGLAFLATRWLIPVVAAKTLRRGICGKDLNKAGTPAGDTPIPEAVGLAPAAVFLLAIIGFELAHYYDARSLLRWLGSGFGAPLAREPLPEAWLVDYNAALASIGFMVFLGFADDVLDIPWRVKLVLPLFASLPLLAAYSGGTGIVVPRPLRAAAPWLPPYLELGLAYSGYMVALTIFCTNSINILAGVNGLEAGQTLIVAAAMLTHNLSQLAAGAAGPVADGHLFSAVLLLPLAGVCLGLLAFNWYPSSVFVGDTFTYFGGMTIAVAGILGHTSETLLLFLIPQVFNFVYSVPQLFGLVPCPRHRLPVFDPRTGLLRPKPRPDWNLVNLMLQAFGPCSEPVLCGRILALQAACCGLGFAVRWALTGVYKA